MRRSTIVDTTNRLIFHSAVVLSVYLLFAGHNQPGGGFVGGLVAGSAVAVHYVAGGIGDVRRMMVVKPWIVLGVGLVVAAGTAIVPMLVGGSLLESDLAEAALPVLGDVKLASPIFFDAGVYLIVVGLVVMVFEAFGEEPIPDHRGGDAAR